jgi:starvation-inducible DNA-binding protein
MFGEQYNEMWTALDELAERVRALGVFAPASGKAFAKLTAIDNADEAPPQAAHMVKNLLAGHETLIRRARESVATAEEANDAASADLLTQRIQSHEKTAWMLRATAA